MGKGLSLLWVEHCEHLIGLHRKRLLEIPSSHVEEIVESGAMGKRGGIQISIQCLDVAPLPAHRDDEHQDLEIVEMAVPKLAFQRTEKAVEFGG
jgi:hypothetical protein